jgi:hypothetical protein
MTTLAQKLLIRPGKRWLVMNAFTGYSELLKPLPENTTIIAEPIGNFDGVQLFVKNSGELASSLKVVVPLLKPDTIFWVTYPKRSSGMESDLKMGTWQEIDKYGLEGVASIAVNEQWAGSRFRPVGQAKISGIGNRQIKQNEYAAYIDVDNKIVTLPPDVNNVLNQTPRALTFFQQLSYSNKKEYVLWILTAKQEKTRDGRLIKLVEKLLGGKKNPAEK